jgi:hypothetical protein
MGKKVNLFIVGAPKCGTTSLANYLGESSHVFLPKIKEPHFFSNHILKESKQTYIRSFEQYNELYSSKEALSSVYSIDASVWYYSHKKIAHQIFEYNPDAKIIFIIRNPIDAIRSLYLHRAMALEENEKDINKALLLEKHRKDGFYVPENLKSTTQGLYYTENYNYLDKIKSYQEVFGAENVKVLLFDMLVNDKVSLLEEVFRFLKIDYDLDQNVINQKYNEGLRYRNTKYNKIVKLIPKRIKQILKPKRFVFFDKKINSLLKENDLCSEYNATTKGILSNLYLPQMNALEVLLDINLKEWKTKY